jgi:pre-mRNA-splicing factor 38A
VDEMLTKERVCGTSLWKLPKREVLEDLEVLEPRVSELGDIEELLAEEDDDVEEVRNGDGDESERSPGEEFGEEVVEDTGERMDVDSADKGDDASRGEGL